MGLLRKALILLVLAAGHPSMTFAQRLQFPVQTGATVLPPSSNYLRPVQGTAPGTSPMVPIYPNAPSTIGGFDPYARPGTLPAAPLNGNISPPVYAPGNVPPSLPNSFGNSGFPQNPPPNTLAPPVVGGQSGVMGTFQNNPTTYGAPGIYPSNTPSSMYPGGIYPNGYQPNGPNAFSSFWNNLFGSNSQSYSLPPPVVQGGVQGPAYAQPNANWGAWNPQGAMFEGSMAPPGFIRLFQGPRFRHAFIYGNNDTDALMINDSDVAVAFAWPNFLFSNQPLFILPSFSLHQWDGPHPPSTADLPPLAYSAFLDAGWHSDPERILGAELGLRVGMFSDFDTANSDSLRIMGRAIGRVRVTPNAIIKGGVIYLDRNKIKLLPAGGLLWYPNENTRLDIFFPEPKLASYLTTIGNTDTWWYAGGYYGGGSWTIERADTSSDSIDINDLRIVFGLEFGRNEQMREGRRVGFIEVGYVFDRELIYKASPLDNMDLQDTVMVRAGFGY